MVDEEKQIDNTADQQGDTLEEKRAMTSEATDETMNLNDEGTQPNAQVATGANPLSDNTATGDENAVPGTHKADAEYQQVSSDGGQVESLKAQLEERNTQYMRIAADFENFRKRNQKEKEDLEQQVKRATITELLPVVDNFERARSHIKPQTDAEMNIHKSYQSVYKQLVDSLKRLGVSPMRPEGKEFDPNLHEAVMRQPTNEHPEGTVLEELVRGYFLGDRVLRHAMVKVAAAPESVQTSEENPTS
jgi:molecular chaperone GrpE